MLMPTKRLLIALLPLLFMLLPLAGVERSTWLPTLQADTLSFDCSAVSEIPTSECNALVTFYNSTGGASWTNNTGWLVTTTPCSWNGVTCTAGRVTALQLPANNLSGALPAQLSDLTQLITLVLRDNLLTGGIPSSLGSLTKLQTLTLSYNQLSGSIPVELGNLSSLTKLLLAHNQLSGSLPAQLGNLSNLEQIFLGANQISGSLPTTLGNLDKALKFSIFGNQLSGPIPAEIGDMASLQQLSLYSNQLSGEAPAALGGLALNFIELKYNRLTASDPSVLALLAAEEPDWYTAQTIPPSGLAATPLSGSSVQLSWTSIAYTSHGGYYEVAYAATPGGPYTTHGTTSDKSASSYLVDGLSANTKYYFVVRTFTPAHPAEDQQSDLLSDDSQEVAATTSGFSCVGVSEIPQSECEALSALYNSTGGSGWLNQSGWLTSNTPCSWYGITCGGGHVTDINLRNNQLTGVLPAALGQLTNVVELTLRDNQLTGSIPPELGALPSLTRLGLGYNQLSGAIPKELGNLGSLEQFFANYNQLSGPIPTQLGNLPSLRHLYLNDNQLTGGIPKELGNLSQLQHLWLVRNQLSGPIPGELTNLTNLTGLAISQNQLSGLIPTGLGNLSSLTELYLSDNQLQGAIPSQLGSLTGLTKLYLFENQLSGPIPPSLVNLTKLTGFSLTYNKLSASDAGLINFLNAKNPGWQNTQTVSPTNLQGSALSGNSIRLTWTPIAYTADGGYYEVNLASSAGGPYSVRGVTSDKSANTFTVTGLNPATKYYFVVRSYTPAHNTPTGTYQQNDLYSDFGQEVAVTTLNDQTPVAPSIISTPVSEAVAGRAYAYNVVATGSAPITYKLLSSPPGMTINSASGIIAWTPNQGGVFNVSVEASNAVNKTTQNFSVTVSDAPDITSSPVTQATHNQPYAYDVDASGNPPPTFSLPVKPTDMTINATSGLIAWTPTTLGAFSVTVQASNSIDVDSQSFVINVGQQSAATAPAFTSQPLTSATVNQPYAYDANASGSPQPSFSLVTSPVGMQINSTTGAVAWTPSSAGVFNVTLRAANSAGTVEQFFTINVAAPAEGDGYEEDDSCERADLRPIIPTTGAKQFRTFHDASDQDWLKFTAQANKSYIIEVVNVGAKADAVIALYNSCNQAPSGEGSNTFGSTVRLEWDSGKNGDYYIQLRQFDGANFGNEANYEISVTADNIPPSAPLSPRCFTISANALGIQWKKSPERDVRGYRINYVGNVSGSEDVIGGDKTYHELGGLNINQTYSFRALAVDFSGNESAQSGLVQCIVSPQGDSSQPSITLTQPSNANVYSTTAELLTFTGLAQDAGNNLVRVQVKNLTNNAEGADFGLNGGSDEFRVEGIAIAPGANNIRLTVFDDAGNSSQRNLLVQRAGAVSGAVILIAGHNETFGLQTNIYNAANRAYRIFKTAGFSADNIYYIAPVKQDADGDGANDVDVDPGSPATVQNAITTWARESGRTGPGKPLHLYLVDHGFTEKFCVKGCAAGGAVTPAELDEWLRTLESATGANQVNVFIEACQSGSFIDRPNGDVANSLAKAGRVIITSTGRENNAYASAQGAYFSDAFFSCLADSGNLKACFDQASGAVEATGVNQTPWLDDNGDGVYNSGDGAVAQARTVTSFFSSIRPVIAGIDVTRQGANGVLSAQIEEGAEEVALVWAALYPPSFAEPSAVTLNLSVPTVRLEPDPIQPGRYLFHYTNGFTEQGDYRIVFYAQDRLGIHAQPRRFGEKLKTFLPLVSKK